MVSLAKAAIKQSAIHAKRIKSEIGEINIKRRLGMMFQKDCFHRRVIVVGVWQSLGMADNRNPRIGKSIAFARFTKHD